ncbi:Adenylate-forming reductase Nps10 [Psilocybe cubensis]|uniref:Adenylate-forming reductase Nps10 n=2 Tax=Psilocybe cubensis TaxID=181762 RepID=A0ACB8GWX7_PSICU|nr:Adenylate-forming reductase Nps10 [Psilocybe cubensis]KAH9480076.1 Adenylate-forming reductase Nps10 [Psilocybe cubensis]
MSHTESFIAPPSDMEIEYTFDFHLAHNPNYPVFLRPEGSTGGYKRLITYSDIVPGIHRAGQSIRKLTNTSSSSPTPLVAIFAEMNNMTYATVILGCLRAGVTALLISPRFHPSVVAELLRMAGPSHILTNDRLREKTSLALHELSKTPSYAMPAVIDAPLHSDLYPGHNDFDPLPRHAEEFSKRALILHSSCSTSTCPKIIEWPSSYITSNSLAINYSDIFMEGKLFGAQSAEFFHTAGLCFLFWLPRAGFIMAILSPDDPRAVIPADRDIAFEGFVNSQVSVVWSSPRFFEAWSNDPEKVKFLAERECIVFGGSQLSKAAGDRLTSHGVKICNVYGATECGYISKFVSEPQSEDWEYFSLNPGINCQLVPRENGAFEPYIISQKGFHEPAIRNAEWNGRPAYATGDGLVPHPFKKGYYKVIGRNKDQILLSSGQVVDPMLLEDSLREHEEIKSAVVFGHGRPFLGVLIWPNALEAGNDTPTILQRIWSYVGGFIWQPVSESNNDSFERIWSIIEAKNSMLPVHSQIRKEAFMIADKDRPFQFGEKGLPKRSLILDDYRKDIEKRYMSCL